MYNTNSQLVKTMLVWFFLSNVLFFTSTSKISMKNNRTQNQPVSNTLAGLSTHCRFFFRFSLSRILKLRIIWLIFDVGYSMKISIFTSIQDCKYKRVFILQVLEWSVGSITTCHAVSFHKRMVIMVDYSQQFSISILSFTFLFSGTILFLPSNICLFITYTSVHYGYACNSWFHYSLSSKVIISFLLYGIQNNIRIWQITAHPYLMRVVSSSTIKLLTTTSKQTNTFLMHI